jgi:hypothetical protein
MWQGQNKIENVAGNDVAGQFKIEDVAGNDVVGAT